MKNKFHLSSKFLLLCCYCVLSVPTFLIAQESASQAAIHPTWHQERYEKMTKTFHQYFKLPKDSARKRARKAIAESVDNMQLAESYFIYGSLYIFSAKIDTAKKYLQKAVDLADKLNYLQLKHKSLNNLGVTFIISEERMEALKLLNNSYRVALQLADTAMQAQVSINMGILYRQIDAHEQALECYQRSRELLAHRADADSSEMSTYLYSNRN